VGAFRRLNSLAVEPRLWSSSWTRRKRRMAAAILTLVLSFVCGGVAWLALGSRFQLDPSQEKRNDILNLLSYVGISLPVAFGVVFFLLEVA